MSSRKRIYSQTIGNQIRKARKEIGLSQKQLGHALKLSDKAVSSYEIGRSVPSFRVLRKISKVVYKPISYFDEETGNEDMDLAIKISTIEKELAEIKALLKKR